MSKTDTARDRLTARVAELAAALAECRESIAREAHSMEISQREGWVTEQGHLSHCSFQGGPGKDCHICGCTLRAPALLQRIDALLEKP